MWKKEELEGQELQEHVVVVERTPKPKPVAERATIGRSIKIQGQISGDEDLLIQGHVKGSVTLKKNTVTVGPEGEVEASISARLVTIEGKVEGDVSAEEQVVLRSSASVHGDITAPRLVLEDGARFRGGVDMGDQTKGNEVKDHLAARSRQSKKAEKPEERPKLMETSSENGKEAADTAAKVAT